MSAHCEWEIFVFSLHLRDSDSTMKLAGWEEGGEGGKEEGK